MVSYRRDTGLFHDFGDFAAVDADVDLTCGGLDYTHTLKVEVHCLCVVFGSDIRDA